MRHALNSIVSCRRHGQLWSHLVPFDSLLSIARTVRCRDMVGGALPPVLHEVCSEGVGIAMLRCASNRKRPHGFRRREGTLGLSSPKSALFLEVGGCGDEVEPAILLVLLPTPACRIRLLRSADCSKYTAAFDVEVAATHAFVEQFFAVEGIFAPAKAMPIPLKLV